MLEKPAVTGVAIHDLLHRRWSTRAFDTARPLSRDQVASLLEAARWAPSASNTQPYRFLVFDKARDQAGWDKAFACLSRGNQAWAGNAPLLLLSCTAQTLPPEGKPARHGGHDTGLATMSLMMQAVALGLASHVMAGFDGDKARESFAIPADFTPMAMMAVGYQTGPDILPEAVKEKELAPRARRPVGQSFFAGTWGNPQT